MIPAGRYRVVRVPRPIPPGGVDASVDIPEDGYLLGNAQSGALVEVLVPVELELDGEAVVE